MSLDATLRILNDLRASGAMDDYAIGGAVAAFLYIEPAATFDLGIFIAWKPGIGGLLMREFEKIVERHKLTPRWETMKKRLEPL